jgi:chaperone required for assembly of F1-ATPase
MKNGLDTHANGDGAELTRFYKDVTTAEEENEGWRILLDGRPVKTPMRNDLMAPTQALAEAIADEWRAQTARIDPQTMPLTKLANTALDAVAPNAAEVAESVLSFAGRDLVCYRAEGPRTLIERQRAVWDPMLEWAEEYYGARLKVTEGVMPIEQPADSLAALRTACLCHEPFSLTALHVITSLTGSAVLALAHVAGRVSLDEGWNAAHVDEDYQIQEWGYDAEAAQRRRSRYEEMRSASRFYELSQQADQT